MRRNVHAFIMRVLSWTKRRFRALEKKSSTQRPAELPPRSEATATRASAPPALQTVESLAPPAEMTESANAGSSVADSTAPSVVHRAFDAVVRGTSNDDFASCSDEWKRAMLAVGHRMKRANVCAVVFVHGTFAGADPLSLARVARNVPRVGASLESAVRAATKNGIDAILGDLGTFGESYVALFERALGGEIPCSRFVWSSENHHAARLEGAVDLLRSIATHARFGKRHRFGRTPRVLVVGHSHGAQLFALMSHLLADTPEGSAMLDILRVHGHSLHHVEDAIRAARRVRIDAVTFGTPPRYPWANAGNLGAIHVVNDRGDYVRRLGAAGSDLPGLGASAREMNAALDGIFGPASLDPRGVVKSVTGDVAIDPFGTTFFVDYQRAFGALAGHGVYTKRDAMLFHATLAATHFYGAIPRNPAPTAPAENARARA